MKKIYSLILLTSAVSILASCQKEEFSMPVENTFKTLTVSANESETKALFKDEAKGTVAWHTSDKLVVFDVNDDCRSLTHTETTGYVNANFSTGNWTGYEPHFAVASKTEDHVSFTKTPGKLSVYLNESQTILDKKCFSSYAYLSLGRVKKNDDQYSVAKMNQLAGFVKFTLSRTDVAYVVAEAIGGEHLCGWVDIDTTKFNNNVKDASADKDFWSLMKDSTKVSQLVVRPTTVLSESLIFPASDYYMMALPGTYSQGIRFTCYNSDNEAIITKTIGASTGVTLERGQRIIVSSPIDKEELFPKTVNIKLDFTKTNPLGTFTKSGDQTANGETYTYAYSEKVDDKTYSQNVNFTLFKGTAAGAYYYYSTGSSPYALAFASNTNAIQLPAIENRYLKSVKITIKNTADKSGSIQTSKGYVAPAGESYICGFTVPKNSSYTISFNASDTKIKKGVGYWIRFTTTQFQITNLELQYVNKLPTE